MLTLQTTVDFATYNDAALNTTFKSVKAVSRLDYQDAKLRSDVASKHTLMWPYVTDRAKYKDDPKSYSYYSVEFQSGERTVIGEAWINPNTIKIISEIVKEATLYFDNPEQQSRFEAVMNANRLKYQYK